jgi:hypothetical protein
MTMLLIAAALAGEASTPEGDTGFDHDHTAFGEFLKGAVTPTGVSYSTLAERRTLLETYLAQIASADVSSFDNAQKLALYVNAYNAYTLRTMLDEGPPASIRDLDGGKVWETRRFTVAAESLTLNDMEHGHARKLADGRVHAVVNCASKGCPPLPATPLRGASSSSQLDAAAKTWASTNAFSMSGDTVNVSKIFDWYADDFANVPAERDLPGVDGKEEQALWFLAKHVDEATKAKLLSGEITVGWQDYDWTLNKR